MSTNIAVVYVASHTDEPGEGISRYRFNQMSGELTFIEKSSLVNRTLYLARHPSKNILYAVSDQPPTSAAASDKPSGLISALAIDPADGQLTLLNQEPTGGTTPCFVSVDQAGQMAVVSHFRGQGDVGSLCVLPILVDGHVGPATQFLQHEGSSIHPQRQRCSHVHAAIFDKANHNILATDLGRDKLMVYQVDSTSHTLSLPIRTEASLKPGTGPRHLDFHPDGRTLYLINEIGNTITTFSYGGTSGRLTEAQTLSTLPAAFRGKNTCADIHVHPSGKFVYGSNRGHDSLVVFEINPENGQLTLIEHVPVGGQTPRGFIVDPSSNFLLVANQDSHNIVTFRIDPQTGRLTPTGFSAGAASPVCLSLYSTPKS